MKWTAFAANFAFAFIVIAFLIAGCTQPGAENAPAGAVPKQQSQPEQPAATPPEPAPSTAPVNQPAAPPPLPIEPVAPPPAPIAAPNNNGTAAPANNSTANGTTAPQQQPPIPPAAPVCGNRALEGDEQCDIGTRDNPGSYSCPSGQYCSSCKCYTAAQPISCKSNHLFVQESGINQFMYTTLPVCGDDCNDLYGVDYKCDLTKCVCIPKSVTSHTCGNNVRETVEECDGEDNSWCNIGEVCGADCICVQGT